MSLSEVIFDDHTWNEADPMRRLEWEALSAELLDPATLVFRDDACTLFVATDEMGFRLEARDAVVIATANVEKDRLAALVHEYVDVMRQLGATDDVASHARLEALDMAKKVTHDKAGRLVKHLCPEFGMDHETARRLFSLLFALRVDTAKLLGIHGHRAIR